MQLTSIISTLTSLPSMSRVVWPSADSAVREARVVAPWASWSPVLNDRLPLAVFRASVFACAKKNQSFSNFLSLFMLYSR